jgi:flagellin
MSTINTNVQSLNAQRNLAQSTGSLSTSMQRLSSGLRVNSAKDDAAGLAISERMNAQVKGMNVAIRNANDGISLAQTAEGALGKVGDMLQRVRELAVQSANATNSGTDRASLQAEAQQLMDEIDRTANTTKFNGTKLLDGNFTNQAFQVGANQGETISIANIADTNISALGSWTAVPLSTVSAVAAPTGGAVTTATPATLAVGNFNGSTTTAGDTFTLSLDNGSGSPVTSTITAAGTAVTALEVGTALEGASGYTFSNGTTAITSAADIGTAIGAGNLTIERADGSNFSLSIANATVTGTPTPPSFAVSGPSTDGVEVADASFAALSGDAFTINGTNIEVGTAASASVRVDDLVAAINGTSGLGVTASKDATTGALSLVSTSQIVVGGSTTAIARQTGLNAGTTALSAGVAQTGFSSLDISTVDGANNAMLAMDAALSAVNESRGELGAIQSRFENVIATLQVNSENTSAARGRIVDAAFAKETANLSRSQILQQAGTAMIAQANQLPQGVLSLLR